MDKNGMTSRGLRLDISFATGFLFETGLYCTHACLFVAAFPVMSRRRQLKDSRSAGSAWAFLIIAVMMYLVATAHLRFCFYKSIFVEMDVNGAILYLQTQKKHWEFYVLYLLLAIQTWSGDALVIYRCYIVWDNNLWLIAIPICLLLGYTGIYVSLTFWAHNPFSIATSIGLRLYGSFYPVLFAQNFVTTSLIVLKIFLQHRASKKAGVVDVGSTLSLIHIVRIVIESAGIYTIQILVLNILFFKGDNFLHAIQLTVVPTIGITFLLLTIRVDMSRNCQSTTSSDLSMHSSMPPQWLREPGSEISSENPQECTSLPLGDGADGSEQKLASD